MINASFAKLCNAFCIVFYFCIRNFFNQEECKGRCCYFINNDEQLHTFARVTLLLRSHHGLYHSLLYSRLTLSRPRGSPLMSKVVWH